jgi:thiamine biosynthesis protein ThiS
MQIVVNGEQIYVADSCTIAGLLEKLQISLERVAVEVNLDIVPKAQYNEHLLSAGDKVEIVQFVGGG